jgi:hypothetical protein
MTEKKELTFNEAFLKIQEELPIITFDKKNEYSNNSKYASLPAIMEVLKPLLIKYEIILTQEVIQKDNQFYLKTTLLRKKESKSYLFPLFYEQIDIYKSKNAWWNRGAAITYVRRYSLAIIFNIITDDDLDGQEFTEDKVHKNLLEEFNTLALLFPQDANNIFNHYKKTKASEFTLAELGASIDHLRKQIKK